MYTPARGLPAIASSLVVAVGLTCAAQPPQTLDKPPSDADLKAQKVVEDELARLKGTGGRAQAITDATVERVFPSLHFVAVFFPLFPIARKPPEGLKPADVYAVSKNGKPELMTEPKALQDFFARNLPPVKDEKTARDALVAWLRLTQEFSQDGFYHFTVLNDTLMVMKEGDGWRATGKVQVVPERGNKGEIRATLAFDAAGKLANVEEQRDVQPGVRPRVQD